MGLFIGASILTILELFDYLYEVRLPFPILEPLRLAFPILEPLIPNFQSCHPSSLYFLLPGDP